MKFQNQHDELSGSDNLKNIEKKLEQLHHVLLAEIKSFRNRFERKFSMLFLLVVFLGITLVWYGFWTIISDVPIISNPYVSLGVGLVILLVLGRKSDLD